MKHTQRTLWLTAVITIIGLVALFLTSCKEPTAVVPNDKPTGGPEDPTGPAVITIAAIPGLTPPAAKAAPSKAGIETAQYTGSVAWEPDHAVFAEGQSYTAVITLTAKEGYTLQGVAANFFTVEGATATNAAHSGVVTAVFSPVVVQRFSVSFAEPDGNGTASADPATALEEGVTVTVTADPANGWKFDRWEIVEGGTFAFAPDAQTSPATFQMPAGDVEIMAVFEELPPDTPNLAVTHTSFAPALYGYAQPALQNVIIHNSGTGAAHVTGIAFTGDDSAFTFGGVTGSQTIAVGQSATLTVHPDTGLVVGTYTATITVSYDGGKTAFNTVTFTVNAAPITNASIAGIDIPATGNVPDTTATPVGLVHFEVGAVSWNPNDNPFKGGQIYTASVTLTADDNYTFNGLATASIDGSEAAITNNIGTAVTLTRAFPATIQYYAVSFEYVGSGTASADPATAAANATVDITADPENRWKFLRWEIVSGGTFAFTPNAATSPATFIMPAGNVTIRAVFEELPPDTPSLSLTHPEFDAVHFGYALPAAQDVEIHNSGTGAAAVSGIALSGANPLAFTLGGNIGAQTIAAGARPVITVQPVAALAVGTYTAVINVNYDGAGSPAFANVSFTVNAAPITSAAITGITAPATGALPDTTAAGSGNFSVGAVTWSGSPVRFAAGVAYTASVTLTANTGYTFNGLTGATIDDIAAVITNNTGSAVTLSRTFDATVATGAKFAAYWVGQGGDSGISNITDGADTLSRGGDETVTIGAISDGYTLQQWSVNGINTGETGSSFTFSSVGRANGRYVIGLIVSKDGRFFNINFPVTVTD